MFKPTRRPTYPQRAAMLRCAYAEQARCLDDLYSGAMSSDEVEPLLSQATATIAILRRQLSPYR